VLVPSISETNYIISDKRHWHYAVSLSTAQLLGLFLILLLTFMNAGCDSKLVQNTFTIADRRASQLDHPGYFVGVTAAVQSSFGDLWTARGNLGELAA
jgi:hypothetical protein